MIQTFGSFHPREVWSTSLSLQGRIHILTWNFRNLYLSPFGLCEELQNPHPSVIIDYEDVKAATRNFHRSNKIGEGAFGAVYKVRIFSFLFRAQMYHINKMHRSIILYNHQEERFLAKKGNNASWASAAAIHSLVSNCRAHLGMAKRWRLSNSRPSHGEQIKSLWMRCNWSPVCDMRTSWDSGDVPWAPTPGFWSTSIWRIGTWHKLCLVLTWLQTMLCPMSELFLSFTTS